MGRDLNNRNILMLVCSQNIPSAIEKHDEKSCDTILEHNVDGKLVVITRLRPDTFMLN